MMIQSYDVPQFSLLVMVEIKDNCKFHEAVAMGGSMAVFGSLFSMLGVARGPSGAL